MNYDLRKIAAIIDGAYIPEINTIDCRGQRVKFTDLWLNENHSFDFKLINVSNNWNDMFADCPGLKYLPDHFTIPEGVTTCEGMFFDCQQLIKLPEQFTIPDTVKKCNFMFGNCISLKQLPSGFRIPDNCDVRYIFAGCDSLDYSDPQYYKTWDI